MNGANEQETSPSNLGRVIIADEVVSSGPSPRRARSVIILLAASVGLMMTGFGIILPVFARRLGEFGSGVEALGLMTMSFALAQLVAAPFMGSPWHPSRRPISGFCWSLLRQASLSSAFWRVL